MQQSDQLYQGYLEEMHSLENFRATYTGVHEGVPLEREDPEVRRLIEAMAFFTARTRASALKNLLATRRRLFQQFFSFLLSPLPAMGFLQAQISGRFAEPANLPGNAEVAVLPEEGGSAMFRTLGDLRILPIRLDGVETLDRGKAGARVVLHLKAAYARNDEVGTLSFLVNHLNDYQGSLNVLDSIRKHARSVQIVYDKKVDDTTAGEACELTFGSGASDGHPHAPHPIQRVRTFFHFPQRELFMNVKAPRSPRNWKRFSLIFDLGAGFPKAVRLNPDIFVLFAVPIVNLATAPAQPLLCDGLHERYPLRHGDTQKKFALHSVVGVYELAERGRLALRPGLIAGGTGSYEIERDVEGGQEMCFLKLNYPEAFSDPKKIVVDAMWLQPWFSEKASSRLSAALHDRDIGGLEWDLLGDVKPHVVNALQNDQEGLLQTLALKSKATLNLDEIHVILNALGALKSSHYKGVPALIQDLEVTSAPLPREAGGGLKRTYRVRMKEFDASFRVLVEAFLDQLAKLLNAWTPDANAAVEATLAGGDVIRFG